MEKKKYIKPHALSLGDVAPVSGASSCSVGPNPDVIPYCNSGSIATGNCSPTGQNAGQVCWTTGQTAAGCLSGATVTG